MNLKSAFIAALVAGLVPAAGFAQTAPAAAEPAATAPAAPAPHAPPAAVAPTAFPAKIALISFQQAVIATNEGQQALADIRKKFGPKQTELEALSAEIDSLKKQLQSAPSTSTDAEHSARMKTLDTKQKQLDRGTEDARNAYQADLQDAYGKIAQKVNKVLLDYVQNNGYTILFDVSNEQTPIMWAAHDPSADITGAVIEAYNTSSKVAPPVPDAPASHPKPATTPHTSAKPPAN